MTPLLTLYRAAVLTRAEEHCIIVYRNTKTEKETVMTYLEHFEQIVKDQLARVMAL